MNPVLRISAGFFVVALTTSLLTSGQEARAAGVYVDASGDAGFLVAHHRSSVQGAITLTDRDDVDASMYVVSIYLVPYQNFLINIEQAYVSTSFADDIVTGFGDLKLAARGNIYLRAGRALRFIATLRTGNGSVDLFPYSTESLDLELALGYVDSLERVHVWGRAGVTSVNRENADLPEAIRHDDHLRVDAGVAIPFGSRAAMRAGVTALAYRVGTSREIYFAGLSYDYSEAMRFRADVQVEGGAVGERVSDRAVTVGIDISF